MFFVIVMPRPVPCTLFVTKFSALVNGSNICSRKSCDIPYPLSAHCGISTVTGGASRAVYVRIKILPFVRTVISFSVTALGSISKVIAFLCVFLEQYEWACGLSCAGRTRSMPVFFPSYMPA